MSAVLSPSVALELAAFAARHESKLSPVIDLALKRFFSMAAEDQERAFARHMADKPSKSRDQWRRNFWRFFSEEFGSTDAISNPFAPRTFAGYLTVCLLNEMTGDGQELDPIYVWVGPQPASELRNEQRQFAFERLSSPADAAETVARWILERQ